ncbi:YjeF-related protein N-terminus-domain-containing protein [Schizothecium vesticola]|uniref:Enhancer of mRNA-decapping protein 3 n=1 Tax=Schizothecium vesticola TaxID=314040 RepID=A0AA40KC62_9PEZI|nr:YjeF-related protein N-terminus-domain-containing protein [Schizothecium vesticola]
MTSDFIGLQVVVTVRDPPSRVKGTVSEISAGAGLTLSNVWRLDTNQWLPRLVLPSSNISDITTEISRPDPLPAPAAAIPPSIEKLPFVDPAILAVGKRPGPSTTRVSDYPPQPNTSEKRNPEIVSLLPESRLGNTSQEVKPIAHVSEPLGGLGVEDKTPALLSADEDQAAAPSLPLDQESGKRKRNRRPRRAVGSRSAQDDVEASPQAPKTAGAGQGPGWRQTPILESSSSFQPFKSLKKAQGKQVNENGWASEDVTDVQEAGDFDFEGGLAKFDKQNLFEQMRKDDTVDDADRLVTHNRQTRPKPGTGGGRNFHHTENVLETTPSTSILKSSLNRVKEPANDFWNSEADDGALNGGERLSGRELGVGMGSRQSSRRGESKVSAGRRSQSRKASGVATGAAINRVNSGPATPSQGLYLLPSNRRIEPVSALQMLNLENIAHNEIGLTEDMMTENAGRGIAEVTITALSDPAIQVRHAGAVDPTTGNLPPLTVVVLAGNNKSGIRAIAAARHLRNKGTNVIACVVGVERGERDLLEDMRQQVRLYKNLGGRIFSKSDFFEHLRKISMPILTIDTPRTSLSNLVNPAPVMLIVDALLGLAITFEELRNGDQATVYELIEWANRNEAFALAVDIPTGIDPSSGRVSVVDGNRLYVKPRYVVAVGAPKRGLLDAMVAADNEDGDTVLAGDATVLDDGVTDWKLYLVDLGFGPAIWKKAGTKMRKGIDFGDKWVLPMKFQGAAPPDDDEPGDGFL